MRSWLIALAGVPFLVFGSDFLARQRIFGWLLPIVYGSQDPHAIEARDTVWAVVFVMAGLTAVIYGIRDLISPRHVLTADERGIRLALRGPFATSDAIPWSAVDDWWEEPAQGEDAERLLIRFLDTSNVAANPWGARWIDDTTLSILSDSWERPTEAVVAGLREIRAWLKPDTFNEATTQEFS